MEINKISDNKLKQKLADIALSALINNDLIDQEQIAGIKVEFGYVFLKANGRIEALYRIILANDTVHYFAVQDGNAMHININDDMYNSTVEKMHELHDCLREAQPSDETDAQHARRMKNNELLKRYNILTNENLMCRYDDKAVKLRSIEDVCRRAVACLITVQIAIDIRNNHYEESKQHFLPILERFGVQDNLNSMERRIIDGTYTQQDIIDMDWAYESYWALCWYLGLVEDITDALNICDSEKAISFVMNSSSLEDFQHNCSLRSNKDVLDMEDLYLRYNWAINEVKVNWNINSSVVIERRRALEWLLSDEDDWYQLDLSV